MIKAIVFDYGGVIKINDSDLISDICNYLKINKKDFEKEYFAVNHLINIGGKSFEEFTLLLVSKFNKSKKTKNYILKLLKENKSKYHLNNELIDLIKYLKNKNYKIGLLSNNSLELKQELINDKIYELFDQIIISAKVGYQKPQPEIFEILFSKLKMKPNEVIFVDDTPKSLEGADKIGYVPILFTNNKQLRADLSSILNLKLTQPR